MLMLLLPVLTSADDFQKEYFQDISMDCDIDKYNFSRTDLRNRYWLLPDDRLVDASLSDPRIKIEANYTLRITKIDDVDFGRYSCLLLFSNFTMAAIQHGVNVDGPYFGDLISKYRKNAIVGGIAAGSLFAFLAGGCLVYNFRFNKRSQRNKAVDALDKAIDGFDLQAYDNVVLETDTAVTNINNHSDETAKM